MLTAPFSRRPRAAGPYFFLVLEEEHSCRSRRELLPAVLRALAARDPGFLERAAARLGGRARPYLARDRGAVMRGRRWRIPPARLPGGWWVRSQFNRESLARILPRVAEAAGLRWGEDLIVDLD